MRSITAAAATATGEWRKLQARSLSQKRSAAPVRRPGVARAASANVASDHGAIDAQPRVDDVIKQVDDEIDDDEKCGDEDEVSGHHRDIDEGDRLDEEQTHAGPLKYRLGDDREGDNG